MKSIIILTFASILLTGCTLFPGGMNEENSLPPENCSGPRVSPLWVGQDVPIGTVTLSNDADNLYVKYKITSEGWCISETPLHIGTSATDFPLTTSGNPKVELFDYSTEHDCVTEYEYPPIPLDQYVTGYGESLFVAAHAIVQKPGSIVLESRAGTDVYGPLDSYSALGDPAWGEPAPSVATWKAPSWPMISDSDAVWISNTYYEAPIASDTWGLFHEEINIPGTVIAANLTATADNAEEVYLNGMLVGSDGEVQGDFIDDFEWGRLVNYPLNLQSGANSLDIIVRNYGGSSGPTSNPTGLIYKVDVDYYKEETAWSGAPFTEQSNVVKYLEYEVQCCRCC